MTGNYDNLPDPTGTAGLKKEIGPLFSEIADIAQYLWERGWAERNAGNFSINVSGHFQEKTLDRFSVCPPYPLVQKYDSLARQLFLVSGTGTRMREVARNPEGNVCFVYVNDAGCACHIIGEEHEKTTLSPTSEISAHLAVQQQLLKNRSPEKVVLHAHVTELIALTHLSTYTTEDAINLTLWKMHPETLLFLPDGIGFIPFKIPGGENIAAATIKGFQKHKVVVWEKHGCMAIGQSISEAFDNLDILAKSAKIFFLAKSSGLRSEGLTYLQLKEIRDNLPK